MVNTPSREHWGLHSNFFESKFELYHKRYVGWKNLVKTGFEKSSSLMHFERNSHSIHNLRVLIRTKPGLVIWASLAPGSRRLGKLFILYKRNNPGPHTSCMVQNFTFKTYFDDQNKISNKQQNHNLHPLLTGGEPWKHRTQNHEQCPTQHATIIIHDVYL